LRAFYSDTFVLPLPEHHRFPMAKYRRLRERLVEDGVLAERELCVPDPVSWQDLRLAHDDAYIESVATGSLTPDAQRRIGFPWSPMMVERSRRSVGATLAAAREALDPTRTLSGQPSDAAQTVQPGVSANLAGGTHHAFRDHGEGYCVFNDVAVAARVLIRDGVITRAVVIDCDVHQGNGTASIFRDDPSVFTLSFHGEKNYPFRKELSDRDVTFADGTGDAAYLRALHHHVPGVLDDQQPEIVFYLAGADPYEGDRLGRLKMTIEGLRARDRFVLEQCHRRGVPVAIAMSGGYASDIEAIVQIHVNTIAEAISTSGGHKSLVL
jgi:acetoin utilization deacetylase AcuC-like enzyme